MSKYDYAGGTPPDDLRVSQSSAQQPHGSAGIANQSVMPTVEQVGEAYGQITQAAVAAALAKREADQKLST